MDNVFSQNEINKIISMYNDKQDIEAIMSELGSNEHYIREILKNNELDRHYNRWSDELYNRLFSLYKSGKTHKEIGYDLVINPNGIGKVLKKKEIEKRTYSETNRRYKRNSEYFDNIDTPNKAYILGLIYADGNNYIYGDKHCLTISLQAEDVSLLERVKDELEYEGDLRFNPLSKKDQNFKDQYILAITDEHMCEQLKKIGVVQRKSLVLKFPTFLRPDLIRHFVRGYFDGDGSIYFDKSRNKEHASLCGTKEFCNGVSNILTSMFVNNNTYKPKQTFDKNTYVLQTGGNLSSYKFLSWMYKDCDIKMERKYKDYLDFCERYVDPKGRVKSL